MIEQAKLPPKLPSPQAPQAPQALQSSPKLPKTNKPPYPTQVIPQLKHSKRKHANHFVITIPQFPKNPNPNPNPPNDHSPSAHPTYTADPISRFPELKITETRLLIFFTRADGSVYVPMYAFAVLHTRYTHTHTHTQGKKKRKEGKKNASCTTQFSGRNILASRQEGGSVPCGPLWLRRDHW